MGEPTWAAKIEPAEHRIDWSAPAAAALATVRLGRAWTTFRDRRLLVVRAAAAGPTSAPPGTLDGLDVAAGDGLAVTLVDVQPEGRPVLDSAAWRNGARPVPGERLGVGTGAGPAAAGGQAPPA